MPQAISSVQNQTYSNIEIIVINDASSDNTEEVVNAIPDERIQYVRHEENKGPAAGRNTGIKAAKGEYIGFLDDDDQWREDKLEKQLHVIKNYDAILCDSLWNGRLRRLHMRPTVSLDDLRKGSFALPTLLAKAKVLREVLFDESLWQGEDWDVFIRIAQRHSIGYVAEPLVFCSAGSHLRLTNAAKVQAGPELENRTAMLYKHREFFGDKWFNYHLANNFLTYIGTRTNRLHCIAYAVRRCGAVAVVTVLIKTVQRWMQSRMWART